MESFVYVFSEESKEQMLLDGYHLLQEDKTNGMYIFLNKKEKCFSLPHVDFVLSNSLSL
jgi:hypothetical protein